MFILSLSTHFSKWGQTLVLLEEKTIKPGTMEMSTFGAEDVSEMVEIIQILG